MRVCFEPIKPQGAFFLEAPKMAQVGAEIALRRPKIAPRSLWDCPIGLQDVPRWLETPQESHERFQERFQEAQR